MIYSIYIKMINNLRWIVWFSVLVLCSCNDPHSPELVNVHDPHSVYFIPNAPSNFSASIIEESRRVLSWQDNSGFEAGYIIERKLGLIGTYTVIARLPADCNLYEDTSIAITDTVYYYRISSISVLEKKSFSESLAVIVPFPVPTDLFMTCLSSTSVKLEWKGNCSFETGYRILESLNYQPFVELASVTAPTKSYIVNNLNSQNRYRFKIQAFTQRNTSRYSKLISISYVAGEFNELYSRSIKGASQAIYSMAFSPDGQVLACAGKNYVVLYRVGDGATLAELKHKESAPVWKVRYSSDGSVIATAHSNSVYLWDPITYKQIATLSRNGTGTVHCISFSPTSDTIAAATDSGYIYLWRVHDQEFIKSIVGINSKSNYVAISPDGQFIAAGDQLQLIRIGDGTLYHSFPNTGLVRSVTFNPSGASIAVIGGTYKLTLWDISDGTLLRTFEDYPTLREIAFNTAGDLIVAAGRIDNFLNIWQVSTGTLFKKIDLPFSCSSVAFSPLNNAFAAGNSLGQVYVFGLSDIWKTD
ncbi:MAG: hypothetical protein ABSB78_03290 [Bacteroidota bacterium]